MIKTPIGVEVESSDKDVVDVTDGCITMANKSLRASPIKAEVTTGEAAKLEDINDALRIALSDDIEGMERERIEDIAYMRDHLQTENASLRAKLDEAERKLASHKDGKPVIADRLTWPRD